MINLLLINIALFFYLKAICCTKLFVLQSDMFCKLLQTATCCSKKRYVLNADIDIYGLHKLNMFYLTLTTLIINVTLTHCCEITEREHNVTNVIAYTPLIKACIRKFGRIFKNIFVNAFTCYQVPLIKCHKFI